MRAGTASPLAPALGFADDLDALDLEPAAPALIAAEFCHCAAGAPCGNADPLAGVRELDGRRRAARRRRLEPAGPRRPRAHRVAGAPGTFGIVFMGPGRTSAPFVDGRRCVSSGGVGLFRYGAQPTGAGGTFQAGPGLGALSGPLFGPAGAILPGQTWGFQAWYRDAGGPCGAGSNASNAVAVMFLP